jgi:hypothetical protein
MRPWQPPSWRSPPYEGGLCRPDQSSRRCDSGVVHGCGRSRATADMGGRERALSMGGRGDGNAVCRSCDTGHGPAALHAVEGGCSLRLSLATIGGLPRRLRRARLGCRHFPGLPRSCAVTVNRDSEVPAGSNVHPDRSSMVSARRSAFLAPWAALRPFSGLRAAGSECSLVLLLGLCVPVDVVIELKWQAGGRSFRGGDWCPRSAPRSRKPSSSSCYQRLYLRSRDTAHCIRRAFVTVVLERQRR